ncbi:peptidyl-prolyl cis-trans isomerase [Roseibium sp.]|uniref:peptidylprolyl isomerase n=1 Tax=Roseibium sp. TaxID=1936156 RepID=UPI003B51D3F7
MFFKKIINQPLFHFLLIGIAIFAFYSAVRDKNPELPVATIVVSEKDLERLSLGFQSVWRRAPNETELKQLVDAHIKEEVLVREALALSLDQNDTVIRRRLRQKINFLTRSAAAGLTPSDQELKAYFEINAEKYQTEPSSSFEQVYLGETASQDDVTRAQAALGEGADPLSVGKAIMLPKRLPLTTGALVDRTFGQGFFDRIGTLQSGSWKGPVQSGYGMHLVRVTKYEAADLPDLETIREQLVQDWREDQFIAFAEAQYQRLLAQYTITYPEEGLIGDASE